MSADSGDPGNVVLTGFMGTGKTTVGRLLAMHLGYEFVDTDAVVESRHGPIPTIFAEQGEAAFRSAERAVAADLAQRSGLVIATGGGLMLDPASAAALERSGRVFCLVASAELILQRVQADSSRVERPLLADPDPFCRISDLLSERADAYSRFPQIDTAGLEPSDVAADIAGRLGERHASDDRRTT